MYQMADRLMIAGLQLMACKEIGDLFNSTVPTKPSRDFIRLLFTEASPCAIQMYVVDHIAFWLPKTRDKDEWAQLFTVHERFGMEMALAMVRSQTKLPGFLHPSAQSEFAEKHGLDLPSLKIEARSGDEIAEDLGYMKCLSTVTLSE